MKQVMIDDKGKLVEDKMELWELNIFLSRPLQRRTKRISIIANANHLE